MANIIILPDWLITTPKEPARKNWGVRVVDDQIADVAANSALVQKYPDDAVWEAGGQVLAPGFVNSHIHLYNVLAQGIPLTKVPGDFWGFLADFWWPLIEDRLDHEMICAATDLRMAQLLQSGVTTFYDCTEAPNALPGILPAQAEVVRKWGLRATLSFEATERVSKENGRLGLDENAQFVDACKKDGGLLSGLMCHHTTFTCSADFIKKAYEMAQERDVLLHAHVSEGFYEPQNALKEFGMRPVHYYQKLGVAGEGFMASQCVQIEADEIALIAESGIRMTHMPLSNCEVGGGIAPVPELVDAGATVGLGTDGFIDNFYELMRGAFLIHKARHEDLRVMPAHLVWYLATEGGARAMNLEKVGRLEVGWQADLQLIDAHLMTPLEEHNIYDLLLLYRNNIDVRGVMVAGQVKVQEGQVLGADWERMIARTHEGAENLWAKGR